MNNYTVVLLNGVASTIINPNGVFPVGCCAGSSFQVAGTGDFNYDGNTDILFKDSSGNYAIWYMVGGRVAPPTLSLGNVPASLAVVGIGDFDGNGAADILWRDTSGNLSIWFMSATTNAVQSAAAVANVPVTFSVQATGDYNRDGKSDIMWRDNLGNISIWFMNGATVANTAAVGNLPSNWSIVSSVAQ
jgi:FG-GAP-like repeat